MPLLAIFLGFAILAYCSFQRAIAKGKPEKGGAVAMTQIARGGTGADPEASRPGSFAFEQHARPSEFQRENQMVQARTTQAALV